MFTGKRRTCRGAKFRSRGKDLPLTSTRETSSRVFKYFSYQICLPGIVECATNGNGDCIKQRPPMGSWRGNYTTDSRQVFQVPLVFRFSSFEKEGKKKERNIEYRLKIFNDRAQPLNASISIKRGCFELSWNDNFQLYAEGKKKEAKIE